MSYSCSDFTDDVLAAMVKHGFIKDTDIEDDDPEQQAGLVLGALTDIARQAEEASAEIAKLKPPLGAS